MAGCYMTFHAYRFFKHGSRSMPGAQGLAMMAGGRAPAAAGNYQARNDEEEGAQQYNRPAPPANNQQGGGFQAFGGRGVTIGN